MFSAITISGKEKRQPIPGMSWARKAAFTTILTLLSDSGVEQRSIIPILNSFVLPFSSPRMENFLSLF